MVRSKRVNVNHPLTYRRSSATSVLTAGYSCSERKTLSALGTRDSGQDLPNGQLIIFFRIVL
ncbi:MAG: hypothetical protein PHC83_00140 [Bacteroidales bacterium]|nr:hypothetical protein [Bacteroidales bacterium]MDD4210562.1 hypothetical protein [Bacteroidales bacterium]